MTWRERHQNDAVSRLGSAHHWDALITGLLIGPPRQCTMHDARCTMHNAKCTMHNVIAAGPPLSDVRNGSAEELLTRAEETGCPH